jgi:hypothetical protein
LLRPEWISLSDYEGVQNPFKKPGYKIRNVIIALTEICYSKAE